VAKLHSKGGWNSPTNWPKGNVEKVKDPQRIGAAKHAQVLLATLGGIIARGAGRKHYPTRLGIRGKALQLASFLTRRLGAWPPNTWGRKYSAHKTEPCTGTFIIPWEGTRG